MRFFISRCFWLFTLIIFLSACSGGFEAQQALQFSSENSLSQRTQSEILKVSDKLSVRKKIVKGIDTSMAAIQSASVRSAEYNEFANLTVEQGSRFVALLDNDCLKEVGESDFSQTLAGQEFDLQSMKQKKVAYSLALTEDTNLQELALKLDETGCAIHMQDEGEPMQIAYTNDPLLASRQQATMASLDAQFALEIQKTVTHKQDVIVAVLDTGLDTSHEDIDVQKVWRDSRGFRGIDFVNNDYHPQDDHKHGTFVASLIGAQTNNGVGIAGVPGTGIKLMPVKILDQNGMGFEANLINGIYFAIENGAHVINLSVGFSSESPTLKNALKEAVDRGLMVISAAGNSSKWINNDYFISPAGYAVDQPGHLSVGAIDNNGALASFSNYGSHWVEIAAPGVDIYGAIPGNRYEANSGTSASAPLVSGAAALLIYQRLNSGETYSPREIEDFILAHSKQNPSLSLAVAQGRTLNFQSLYDGVIARGPSNEPELEVDPLPENPGPDEPVTNPEDTKIYTGAIESVTYQNSLSAVVIRGWGCKVGDASDVPKITFFYDAMMNEDYFDYPDQRGLPSTAATHTTCDGAGNFNFEHRVPLTKILKLQMEGMSIAASVGVDELASPGKGAYQLNGSFEFEIPDVPDSEYDFIPPMNEAPEILGEILSASYDTDTKRVIVTGWACEKNDPLPAKIYLAGERESGGFITVDVIEQADQPSPNRSRTLCGTTANHGFRGEIRLSSVDSFGMEEGALRVTAYGAYRTLGATVIDNPDNIVIPTITQEERETEVPEPETVPLGAITSITFNPDNKAVVIQGWACEVGVNGPAQVEVLSEIGRGGFANRYGTTTLASNSTVRAQCQTNGTHNFRIEQPAYINDSSVLKTGGDVRLRLVNGPNNEFRHELNTGAGDVLPTIPELINENELIGAVTSQVYDANRDELVIRGWICEKGLTGSVGYNLDILRAGTIGRVSFSYNVASLPSPNSVKNECGANGNFNFEHVVPKADLDKYTIREGDHVRLYGRSNVEGQPSAFIGVDANWLVPALD